MKALPWVILSVVGLMFIVCLLIGILYDQSWASRLVWLAVAVVMFLMFWKFFFAFLRQIPFDPPTVGIEVIRGQRRENILTEGWYFMLPWWDLYTARLVNIQKKSLDISLSDVRTKIRDDDNGAGAQGNQPGQPQKKPRAGGEISIKISLTWFPAKDDPKELIAFLNSGGETGVNTILEDIVEEEIREAGHDYSWEEISFSTDEVRQRIIQRLTGQELSQDRERELSNGLPVVADLGIKICRVNVGKVKEQGQLARAAEKKAVEEQERAGEQVEQDFVQQNTQKYVEMGMQPNEAANVVLVSQGKIKNKEVRAYEGLSEVAKALGEGIAKALKK